VLRVTRREYEPPVAPVTDSVCVNRKGWPQPAVAPGPPVSGARVSVPEDGETVRPLGTDVTRQRTDVARPPADAAPICTAVGCPTAMVVAPLGSENPTIGSSPAPNDGGLAAGEEAHVGSGELDRV